MSPIGQDPEGLVIAHYAPGKEPQANPELLVKIQDLAKDRVRDSAFIEVIGVHLPQDISDDPFLSNLLNLMKCKATAGGRVIYVNCNPNDTDRARATFGFETAQRTFQDYVENIT